MSVKGGIIKTEHLKDTIQIRTLVCAAKNGTMSQRDGTAGKGASS